MNDIIHEAQLGIEAEAFKNSKLGLYLRDKAENEIMDASSELTTVNPKDVDRITELQNQVYRANSILIWIEEAIENGDYAINEINESRGEE